MTRPSGLYVDRRVLGLQLVAQHDSIAENVIAVSIADATEFASWLSAWRRVSESIVDHFVMEETLLLPDFAAHDPPTARRLLDEHVRVRDAVDTAHVAILGIEGRAQVMRELARMLRECAAREEASLYAWALGNEAEEGVSSSPR